MVAFFPNFSTAAASQKDLLDAFAGWTKAYVLFRCSSTFNDSASFAEATLAGATSTSKLCPLLDLPDQRNNKGQRKSISRLLLLKRTARGRGQKSLRNMMKKLQTVSARNIFFMPMHGLGQLYSITFVKASVPLELLFWVRSCA